ncbi:hypothetical protein TI05_01360 [Achromatium sp. WMS3]|nr:hypothetical protein TI05_01360 [Achromatium sp. WMS3]
MNHKEQLSELLDDALDPSAVDGLLGMMHENNELRDQWNRYQLIGQVLRDDTCYPDTLQLADRVRSATDKLPSLQWESQAQVQQASPSTLWQRMSSFANGGGIATISMPSIFSIASIASMASISLISIAIGLIALVIGWQFLSTTQGFDTVQIPATTLPKHKSHTQQTQSEITADDFSAYLASGQHKSSSETKEQAKYSSALIPTFSYDTNQFLTIGKAINSYIFPSSQESKPAMNNPQNASQRWVSTDMTTIKRYTITDGATTVSVFLEPVANPKATALKSKTNNIANSISNNSISNSSISNSISSSMNNSTAISAWKINGTNYQITATGNASKDTIRQAAETIARQITEH